MNSIKDIWDSQLNASKNKVIRERVIQVSSLTCFIGTITFSNAKIFLLELDSNIDIHQNYLKRFIGVEVQIIPNSNNKKELAIILLDEELTDIFVVFIEDIINSLLDINDSKNALIIISRRINYWKKLFGKFSTNLLTPQQQRGLFGELFFLNKVLIEKNNKQIINAWKAPNGTNQDFYTNIKAIEVKTSISNSQTIKIANEYQLDISGLNKLFIAFYKLYEFPDGTTLLSLINDIRIILNSEIDLINVFNAKLINLGVLPELEEEYNEIGYSVRDEKYYDVTSEFPKITALMVNESISKISYEIDLGYCLNFETTFTEILNEILDDEH
ncbi:PD-(D/E)XK motif protein [Tenacibaculum ovolyticum]|uniref:PD-(D/E)XK motif protein n=1 Tax=Tenacibaculum ovolyticum TaxID=104270 RepID=UPI0022F3FD3C|nr:PD-(D/E)XK motif protein [Tenacibaculum ovolyticum]WBX78423.1 PD-(D/E)XK motif protein [Tenacibaculum ovolyticum]